MLERIPFNQPALTGDELAYVEDAVRRGHSSSKGHYTELVTALLREQLGAEDVLLTTSCTAALELAALLMDLGPGDRVIVPSFTFVTTALAFARTGAEIVFVDIEPETLGMDPAAVAKVIDERVKVVVPVHYAGIGMDMSGLRQALTGTRATIVEDNAHGLYGTLDGQPLGSFGRLSTLSFHETKNFVCGEGGALVLNSSEDVERAHVVLDKGTNRRAFLHGQVDKYTWVDTGSSFGLSDLLAAYLLAQLESREQVLAARRQVTEWYRARLGPLQEYGLTIPEVPAGRTSAYHMFHVLLPDRAQRDELLSGLAQRGFQATFHYVPLHSAPAATKFGTTPLACPVTEDISQRLLRLPFYNNLTESDVDRICAAVEAVISR